MMDLVSIGFLFFRVPYSFGGNHPTIALDCSGFVNEVLISKGVLTSKDRSAQMLYDQISQMNVRSIIERNSILFFGQSVNFITHVAIAVDNFLMIEAGGEGRQETDKGYVRLRPITNRRDLVAAIGLR